jgi:hypothetical protein
MSFLSVQGDVRRDLRGGARDNDVRATTKTLVRVAAGATRSRAATTAGRLNGVDDSRA